MFFNIMSQSAITLALFLIAAFALSFLAHEHWGFSLLAQFRLQYFFGALILLPLLLLFSQSYLLSFVIIIVALCSFVQTRLPMAEPYKFKTDIGADKHKFTIMQYNKYYKNRPYHSLKKYIKNSTQDIDLIIMQEVEDVDIPRLTEALIDTHPYTLPTDSARPDFIMIHSKYPINNLTIKNICTLSCGTRGVRFDVRTESAPHPITIYSAHTKAPIGQSGYTQHKEELMGMAQWIVEDNVEHVIFMGDWNTTPYTPIFKTMMETSKLNYQNYGLIPEGTWPSLLVLPIFKISIDHILFSNSLNLIDIHKSATMGSDHHSLVANFSFK